MKAESTIEKEMYKLFRLSEKSLYDDERREAYIAATALQWVIQTTSWTPSGLIKGQYKEKTK